MHIAHALSVCTRPGRPQLPARVAAPQPRAPRIPGHPCRPSNRVTACVHCTVSGAAETVRSTHTGHPQREGEEEHLPRAALGPDGAFHRLQGSEGVSPLSPSPLCESAAKYSRAGLENGEEVTRLLDGDAAVQGSGSGAGRVAGGGGWTGFEDDRTADAGGRPGCRSCQQGAPSDRQGSYPPPPSHPTGRHAPLSPHTARQTATNFNQLKPILHIGPRHIIGGKMTWYRPVIHPHRWPP